MAKKKTIKTIKKPNKTIGSRGVKTGFSISKNIGLKINE